MPWSSSLDYPRSFILPSPPAAGPLGRGQYPSSPCSLPASPLSTPPQPSLVTLPLPCPRASSHSGCLCLPEPSQPPPLLQQLGTVLLTHLAPWPRWARAGQKTGLFDKNQEIRPLGLGTPELSLVLHLPGGYSPEKALCSGSSTAALSLGSSPGPGPGDQRLLGRASPGLTRAVAQGPG